MRSSSVERLGDATPSARFLWNEKATKISILFRPNGLFNGCSFRRLWRQNDLSCRAKPRHLKLFLLKKPEIRRGEVNKGMIKFTFGRQSHVISEEPRIIFFHYWGHGSAQNLAQSMQQALLATAGTPAKPRASAVRTSASVTRYVQIL